MKKYLIIVVMSLLSAVVWTACGDDSEEKEEVAVITLGKSTSELACGSSEQINVSGINGHDLTIVVEDEEVATVTASASFIIVNGKHVGQTVIHITKDVFKEDVSVTVKPTTDLIILPYLKFGASKEEVIAAIGGERPREFTNSYGEWIDYYLYDAKHSTWLRYNFVGGKLEHITMEVDISITNPDAARFSSALLDYADEDGVYYSEKFKGNIKIYKRTFYSVPVYIFLRQKDRGNEQGMYITFDTDKERGISYLDNYRFNGAL